MNHIEVVINTISKVKGLEPGSLTPDSSLESLEIDSLDLAQIIFELEEHFGTDFNLSGDIAERFNFATPNEIAALIQRQVGE